ncbi:HMG box-containing protein 4-like [Phymastichus coffea]|uniref:HMG box-containing protein 4-like n=1 Tax=Phymastichus coffea TaxID=108790 RepID=UPI00273B8D22|nr:HMG box-containing protein 4-like [Phymastichus coffea]
MDYFSTPKNLKNDDLEVTGISRSGRVRKKSSKLLDFESPDDVTEQRLKRQRAQQHAHAQQILEKYEQSQKFKQQNANSPLHSNSFLQNNIPRQINNFHQRNNSQQPIQIKQEANQEDTQESSEDEEETSESGPEATNGVHHEESSEDLSSGDDDDGDDGESEFEEDEVEPVMEVTGFTKLEPPEQTELPSQAKNSLYMLEKYKKKLVIKDGKVISKTTKSQRKDKGVTRFTAYMLWSKEARQQLVEHHPNLDFATISKKLGELWATVPNLEKHNWKKRAKRLQLRSTNQNNKLPQSSRQFINKLGTAINRENAAPKTINLGVPTIGNKLYVSPPHLNKSGKDLNDAHLGLGGYKVTGTQPIDVAAHLALLGESLTLIGKRLKEHEGQITVSGSLPLLLDSLLCALGPLLCLTQQIPEMNGAEPQVLSSTLENVAYIMPGL